MTNTKKITSDRKLQVVCALAIVTAVLCYPLAEVYPGIAWALSLLARAVALTTAIRLLIRSEVRFR